MAARPQDKYMNQGGRIDQEGRIGGAPFTTIHRDEAEQIRLMGGGNPSRYGGGSGVGSVNGAGGINPDAVRNLYKRSPQAPVAPQAPGGGAGVTQDPYAAQANALYQQLINRGPFRYDLQGDMLYRQYADQYSQLGQQAMRDTMGTAAALTGGYGNSYANLVGNQAYQGYLGQLNSMVPSLYDRAYKVWQDEGDDLLARYQLAKSRSAAASAAKKTAAEDTTTDSTSTTTTTAPTVTSTVTVPTIQMALPAIAGVTPTFTTPTLTPEFSLDFYNKWFQYEMDKTKK